MNCRRVEKLIPLYVEGDLKPQVISRVASHLELCGRCNWLADEYKESQGWLRSSEPPHFDDAFLEGLKGAVLERTREISARPSVFAFIAQHWTRRQVLALTTACVIVLGVLLLYFHGTKVTVAPVVPDLAKQTPGDGTYESNNPNVMPAKKEVSENGFGARHRASKHRARIEPRRRAPLFEAPKSGQPPSSGITAEGPKTDSPEQKPFLIDGPRDTREMLRMEIQTSDPHIRIIWFAPREADTHSAKPVTETTQ